MEPWRAMDVHNGGVEAQNGTKLEGLATTIADLHHIDEEHSPDQHKSEKLDLDQYRYPHEVKSWIRIRNTATRIRNPVYSQSSHLPVQGSTLVCIPTIGTIPCQPLPLQTLTNNVPVVFWRGT
jgi:hypothetical protein